MIRDVYKRQVQELIDKVNGILKNDSEIADMFENTLLHATDYLLSLIHI